MFYLVEITGTQHGFPETISDETYEHDLAKLIMKYCGRFYPVTFTEQGRDEYSIGFLVEIPWRKDDRDWWSPYTLADALRKVVAGNGEEIEDIAVELYEED